ncbi:hypothetical protein PYW08_010504 [Mythimna loreyi]|uniref:Uncharacterized protein n=1 Tax=Mythimna loreyi TaxID=667449 RepID=A0ACC2Q4Z3_9NEOP|nr:hypothetical protein PYW08_010504 [Mythimna loreyi]
MDRAKDIIVDLMEVNSFIEKGQKNNAEQDKGRDCNVSSLVDPLSEDIAKFTEDVPIVKCEGMDWVNCYKSECSIAMEIQKTVKEIVCIYKDVFYLDDRNVYFGNPITVNGNEKYVLNKSDHVKVDCTGKDRTSSLHAHWSGYGFGLRPVPTKSVLDGKDSFNVMILYFGSTSRDGFIRKMRKSYQYMTKQLNAVILNSYLIAYFEDMPRKDTSQNKFNQFRRQPIDHYLQTSLLTDIGKGENWNRNKNWYQGRPADHCFGAKPHYKLMMDLADEFLQLHGMKFCFTFVEDLAYDNFTVLPTVDETLLSFLRTLSARKALEDTLVLIMGDHGSR